MKVIFYRVLPPLLVAASLVGLWELCVITTGIEPFLLPAPTDVVKAAYEDADRLLDATLRTGIATCIGFLFAAVVGIIVGSFLGFSRWLERGFYPPTLLLQMVPLVAVAPLLVIWFGPGATSTVAATVVVAVFPVVANTLSGIRATDPELRELFQLSKASRLSTWWKLELPSALPAIITGLRIAAGLSLIGAITAEFVTGYTGDSAPLGALIIASVRSFQTSLMFAAILIASLIGFLLFGVVNLVGWLLLHRWHASTIS